MFILVQELSVSLKTLAQCNRVKCCICTDAHLTAFQRAVYHVAACVPAGRVTSYGAVAAVLHAGQRGGLPARAVGTALSRNAWNRLDCEPRVPCHRVVAADGRLGGFSGHRHAASDAVRRKRRMLLAEGVPFKERRREWVLGSRGDLKQQQQQHWVDAEWLRAAARQYLVTGNTAAAEQLLQPL